MIKQTDNTKSKKDVLITQCLDLMTEAGTKHPISSNTASDIYNRVGALLRRALEAPQ